MVTAGNRAPQVEFPSSVLPVLWMCKAVFAWFTPSLMNCRVWSQVIAFVGGLSLYSVSCTSLTKNSCNTTVVFNHVDRGSYLHYINCVHYIYICTYLNIQRHRYTLLSTSICVIYHISIYAINYTHVYIYISFYQLHTTKINVYSDQVLQ